MLKRQYTVGELTPEIVALAPAWAFYDKEWLDVRRSEDLECRGNDIRVSVEWGNCGDAYRYDTDCYPCCLHEDGTIERLGE